MIGFPSFFKKSHTCVGIDIGTSSIKAVEVSSGEKMPRILNYAILTSENSLASETAFHVSGLKLFEDEITEYMKLLVDRIKPKTKRAIASLPMFSAFTTVLSFPDMSPEELARAVPLRARQYIPVPLSEVALDWMKVGEYEDEQGFRHDQVFLISVPREIVNKYRRIFAAAGLTLAALEMENVSMARALGNDSAACFVIDIGSRSTSILIVENGQIKFAGQSDFAGASLTQNLAASLSINIARAEELKRERGLLSSEPNRELSTIMLPFLDAILNEVKRVEFAYKSQFPLSRKVERAVLAGGGANLLGIQKYVSDSLGVPVIKAAPLKRFEYPAALEPAVPELNSKLSVALGLALREF